MDISANEITFDEFGVCNFCRTAEKMLLEIKNDKLPDMKGEGEYDVLIGLSGGVDSSMALYHVVQMGLRPLCFTVDNGWNDARADENIMRLVEGLKVPFFRYTIDQTAFKRLQAAFLKAGQKNVEIPTDHVLMATTYEMAAKYGIKYVISGGNVNTESIMPASWGYNARDLVHIKDVYYKMIGEKLKGLPVVSLLKWNWYKWVKGIKIVYLLDFIDYNRADAVKLLEEKFGYKPYGEKHCESVFTQWFQNFYLFEKFGIDKRKAHLSSMINSGQITREEALQAITAPPVYPELGLERKVMRYQSRDYREFRTDEKLFNFISKSIKWLNKAIKFG
jgi:tRNA(Ile)-lysidine synthase TilS/MesJ